MSPPGNDVARAEGEPLQASDAELQSRSHPRLQKRERILSTAARLFYEGGYRATSMESIAEELGVTKPFLYYHFENKHEILDEIARRVVLLSRGVLEEAQGDVAGPELALAACVRGYARVVRAHRPLLMVLFREASNFSTGTQELLAREQGAHVAQLARLLAQGTESGVFCAAQPGATAAAILGFVSFGGAFESSESPSDEARDEHLVVLALRMAGALAP